MSGPTNISNVRMVLRVAGDFASDCRHGNGRVALCNICNRGAAVFIQRLLAQMLVTIISLLYQASVLLAPGEV